MMNPEHLLQSKFFFLGACRTTDRERFRPLFDQILKHRLTTIIAGAGYGKSTLAAQAIDYLKVPAIWFRLDRHDREPAIFWAYLVNGLRRRFPGIGSDILSVLNKGRPSQKDFESLGRRLLSTLHREIRTDFLMIFDDVHTVSDAPQVKASLLDFIQEMPVCMHIVMVSRIEPDWPLALMRARREVLDIRESDLNFTISEVVHFYSEIFQFKPDDEIVALIHQKTAGWISGVILFYQVLRGRTQSEISDLVHKLNGSHDIIAAYIEENIYQRQSQSMKKFLLTTSLLDRLDVDLCQELNPAWAVAEILQELENKHIFTFSVDATRREYYFHHLFRDFLRTKLEQVFKLEEIRNLHRKIAVLLEKRGGLDEALDHYIDGHRWKSACRLFRDAGRWMLLLGHVRRFKSYLVKFPQRYSKSEPMLIYMDAQAMMLECGRSKATKQFHAALNKSIRKGDVQTKYLSLKEIAIEQVTAGNYKEARKRFKALLDMPAKKLMLKYQLEINLVVMINLLNTLAVLGLFEEARHYLGLTGRIVASLTALNRSELARTGYETAEILLKILLDIHTGSAVSAVEMLNQLHDRTSRLDNSFLLLTYYHLKAHAAICIYDYDEALKAAQTGLKLQKRVIAGSEIFAWLNYFAGRAYLGMGQVEEARNTIGIALKLFRDADNYHGLAESYLGMYCVAMNDGNLPKAWGYLQTSHEILKDCTVPVLEGIVLGQLAVFKLVRGDFPSAAKLFQKAKQTTRFFPVQRAIVLCLRAQYYYLQGRKSFAVNYLDVNLRLLSENFENHQDKTWQFIPIIPLMVETYAKGVKKLFLIKLFKQIGPAARNNLTRLARDARPPARQAATELLAQIVKENSPDFEVCFFKSFKLLIGGKILTNENWKNKKALLLFKYLLISRTNGFISKEVLMEFLWPEEDPVKTSNRFHVTLNALRKVLGAKSSNTSMSLYVERQGDKYRLAGCKIKSIDIETFEAEIKMGRKQADRDQAIFHFRKAEEIYTGDFLEDEPYAEWCYELRNHLREQYLNLMTPLLDYYESQEAYHVCIQCAEKFLSKDRFNEDAYRRLMKYHFFMGDRKKAVSIFRRCKLILNEELDIPLSESTISLYGRLCRDKKD